MRKTILNWILSLTVAFTVGGAFSSCSSGEKLNTDSIDEQTYLAQVALTAEQFNQTLPKDEGVLELISYRFDPNQKILTLTHRFTTEDIADPNLALIETVRKSMVEVMSHNADEMDYIQHGITFQFDYFAVNGEFMFSTIITPEDFKDVTQKG